MNEHQERDGLGCAFHFQKDFPWDSAPIYRASLHPHTVLSSGRVEAGTFVTYVGGEWQVGGNASEESHYSRNRNGRSSCH